MLVMKFGGTSVGDRERLARMAELVVREEGPLAIVISAMGGTTDRLLQAGRQAAAGEWSAALAAVSGIEAAHLAATDDPDAHVATRQRVAELTSLLRGMSLLREQTPRSRALLASFGERLSVPLAAAAIRAAGRSAEAVDARDFVRTDETWEEGRVDDRVTREQGRALLLPLLERGVIPVVTGFLGSTAEGGTTVLGRSGSDYSAALLGAVLDAREVVIWTDVDGILTADPRVVPEARSIGRVSYREAAEMSYFGAKVIHPKTMIPCEQRGVPIRIRSTFEPDRAGTLISHATDPSPNGVKTVTTVNDLCLLTVEGRGMAGIPGVSRRIFEAAEAAGVSVRMISQASSEQTVSVVVGRDEGVVLERSLRERLALELAAGWVGGVERRDEVAVLSIIGEGMAGTPGVSGRLFSALGAAGVNVRAIAQGGGERSISVALDAGAARRAVRAVHTAFGLTRQVHLVLVGKGRVARELLRILEDNRERLEGRGLSLRVVAAVGSARWAMDPTGIALHDVVERVEAGEPRPGDRELVARIAGEGFTDVVLVDLSAADLHGLHEAALRAGLHVVTANKVPLSGSLAEHRAICAARDGSRVRYGYETTFGAGLPVLHTLQELVSTGDELRRVEGCFSGTLGYLSTRLDDGAGLVEAVREAQELGFTEPDPREDLSGRDVARKALIIARSIGLDLEPADVELEPFVPGMEGGLWSALEAAAPALSERLARARAAGLALRYVAEIADGRARVGLREVEAAGPIGSLRGPDNILVFTTRRYDRNPLVVRGPGAGAEVTAAGVFGDLLRVTG